MFVMIQIQIRYQELKDWVFLCQKCLTDVKTKFEDSYQYGGTWKSKKNQLDNKINITTNTKITTQILSGPFFSGANTNYY